MFTEPHTWNLHNKPSTSNPWCET